MKIVKWLTHLQLNEGGELDIGTTTGHNFNVVVGQGTIKLASTTFPTGDFDSFVAAGGGTVEYYNSSNFTFDRKVYNNLIINLPNLSTATINDNMTINGNFTIKQGTFQISASGNRTLSVKENVTVETSGKIEVGNVTGVHDFIISGDFVNYGQVKFYYCHNLIILVLTIGMLMYILIMQQKTSM